MPRRKAYPGTIEKRGDAFRVRIRLGGDRYTYTVHADRLADVEEFARVKHAELTAQQKRQQLGLPGSMAVTALLDKYEAEIVPLLARSTQTSYHASLERFRDFLSAHHPSLQVAEVRAAHIKEFLHWRRLRRVRGTGTSSNRTLQKDRAVLHAAFGYAEELELREGNPVSRVKAPKVTAPDPVLLTPDQYEALLEACGDNDMLRLYVLVLGETGARCDSEALRLRWADVDLDGGFLWIPSTDTHRTKSGKGRWVPLSSRLQEALREHAAKYRMAVYDGARSEYLFHHARTRRRSRAGERIRVFRNAFERAVERAQLPAGFTRHDLRHLRATSWLAAGASPVLVKEAMGHSTIQTTLRYTHLAREHLRSLIPEEPSRERLKELGGTG